MLHAPGQHLLYIFQQYGLIPGIIGEVDSFLWVLLQVKKQRDALSGLSWLLSMIASWC